MKIGFLGIQADNANLGLAALAYAGVKLVSDLITGDKEIVLFSSNSDTEIERMRATLQLADTTFSTVPLRLKNPRGLARATREMASCDVVVDFTGGDSFSDIYGIRRLAKKLLHKQMVLWARTPLVLAPQTYGPLTHKASEPWFRHVVGQATQVYTRDSLSAQFLKGLTDRPVEVATDVAVTLPWDVGLYPFPTNGNHRVALNVSGLLWMGGYTGENQFDLRADYREYCNRLLDSLLAAGYEVYLLSHVLARPWEAAQEDDVQACRELAESHAGVELAPIFTSPVEAKSFIAKMDVLIGSRMHATIASFTAGVATIPVAYSRKFSGFFSNLGYDHVVDLTTLDTAAATAQTLAYVEDRSRLQSDALAGGRLALTRVQVFTEGLAKLL